MHLAGSGDGGAKVAAQHPPELVILDLGLPDFDGVEVIRGLRGWTEAPILVLSGRTDRPTRSRRWTPARTTT